MTGSEIGAGLRNAGLPPLYIPMADSYFEVESLPVLPTGKLDLGAVRKIANARFAPELAPA
jgi:acyl-[acyl-carrier-protein]-phospholipid O-acyltransferase/long-chain-fatty-acid--[acyl-carrier-protein] ligase